MAIIEHFKKDREVNQGDAVEVSFARPMANRLHIKRIGDFKHWLNIDLSDAEVLQLLRELITKQGI